MSILSYLFGYSCLFMVLLCIDCNGQGIAIGDQDCLSTSKAPIATLPSIVLKEKSALIFGITGQDGSYLAELLLDKGYTVHGVVRRSSTDNKSKIAHLLDNPRLKLHFGDVTDSLNVIEVVERANPDEIYNLAAQSHVKVSFEEPKYTADVDAQGTLNVVHAIKKSGKKIKFYQASTSELYGKVQEIPQTEATPFYPRSPYGVAKLYGFWITKNYRESYDIFACNGILFNHESPRRGEEFVTRKITLAVAAQACGSKDILYLGNLDSYRDWGFAGDYVEAMWLMLQQEEPDDFVIATGETHTVREFVEKAYAEVGINISWQGSGVEEEGIDSQTGQVLVKVDPRYFRPAEVEYLLGNPAKAEAKLGWKRKMSFDELVKVMVQADKANSCSQQ